MLPKTEKAFGVFWCIGIVCRLCDILLRQRKYPNRSDVVSTSLPPVLVLFMYLALLSPFPSFHQNKECTIVPPVGLQQSHEIFSKSILMKGSSAQNSAGTDPVMLLLRNVAYDSRFQLPRLEGNVPVRAFSDIFSWIKLVRCPISDGSVPVKVLLSKSMYRMLRNRPISVGIVPVRMRLSMLMTSSLVNDPICVGRGPISPFLVKVRRLILIN